MAPGRPLRTRVTSQSQATQPAQDGSSVGLEYRLCPLPKRRIDDQRKSLHKLVLERMVELQNQPTLEGSNPLTEEEIFDEVLGVRPGYKRGLGHGEAPPSRKRVAGYEHPDVDQLRARAEEAESQLEELRGWKEAAQETQETHQAQIQQQQRQLDYLMEKLGGPPSMCSTIFESSSESISLEGSTDSFSTMPTEVKSLSVESSSNEDEPVYMNLDDPIEANSRFTRVASSAEVLQGNTSIAKCNKESILKEFSADECLSYEGEIHEMAETSCIVPSAGSNSVTKVVQ
ncbi:hypothetical protein IFM89_002805 [Coptis chinensis]|uniref:Uncharacterized protein n=1 Tax=Coptis chinensis TaxID=261450 RepID=A0A835HNI5_9MAGN|nr:hypothetical protein IFM89_002805 [Coptis chinensis]